MRIIISLFLLLLIPCVVFSEDNLPFDKSTLEQTYKLDNGNTIYIEQTGMNDAIWEKDLKTNKINKIAHVWSFIALAKSCESIDEKDIYFAQNKEYYLMGGIDEEPTIRIFDLHNKRPWRDSDLGIVPNMEWTKQWCVFYD
jgi:hypothetical protein